MVDETLKSLVSQLSELQSKLAAARDFKLRENLQHEIRDCQRKILKQIEPYRCLAWAPSPEMLQSSERTSLAVQVVLLRRIECIRRWRAVKHCPIAVFGLP
jgi:hypothetical protein